MTTPGPKQKFPSKFPRVQPSLKEEGEKVRKLDETQDKLLGQMKAFGREIRSSTTASSRTPADNTRRAAMMNEVSALSKELNISSMAEGSQVTASTSLFCLLILTDKINEILLQNAALHTRVKELENARNPAPLREGEAGTGPTGS